MMDLGLKDQEQPGTEAKVPHLRYLGTFMYLRGHSGENRRSDPLDHMQSRPFLQLEVVMPPLH